MRIGSESQSHTSMKRAPKLGYMDYLKSTSPMERSQVITRTGEVLEKSPHYEKIKKAESAYQSFYKMPTQIPEIKYNKKVEVPKKDEVVISGNYKNPNQLLNDKIGETYTDYANGNKKEVHQVFEIKQAKKVIELENHNSFDIAYNPVNTPAYKPVPVNKTGSNIDIYA